MKKLEEIWDDHVRLFKDNPKNPDGTPFVGPPLPVEQRNDHYCPFDAEKLFNPMGPGRVAQAGKVGVKKLEARPVVDALNKFNVFDVLYEAHMEAVRVNDCRKYGIPKEPPRGRKLVYDINRDGPYDEWRAKQDALEDTKKDFNPGMQPQLRQKAKPEPSPVLNMQQYEYMPDGIVFTPKQPKAPKRDKYERPSFTPRNETERKRCEKLSRKMY